MSHEEFVQFQSQHAALNTCGDIEAQINESNACHDCVDALDLVNFGSILRFRGYLERPWGPFVAPLWPRTLKSPTRYGWRHVAVDPCF